MSDIEWPFIGYGRQMESPSKKYRFIEAFSEPERFPWDMTLVIAPVLPCSDRIAEAREILATQLDEVGDALGARVIRALNEGGSR